MFSFLKRSKSNDSTQPSPSLLHRVKSGPSAQTKDSIRRKSDLLKGRSKSFNLSKMFLNELQESAVREQAINSSDEDISDVDNCNADPDLNLSLSRFTSINQDKFAPRLLGLLHSKGLSNPFIINENKDFRLSFSSNGEYIFLPSLLDNEEDRNFEQKDTSQYDDPVVYNFAVILSLEKDTNIDIKAAFINSVSDIIWARGVPYDRSIKKEMFELGHLDLNLTSSSMNYYIDSEGISVSELDNEIISKPYKFKKVNDIMDQPYFDSQNEFKLYNRHKVNPTVLKAGDYIFFNSILISPSVTETINTLNAHLSHSFKIFINDHAYKHELKIIRGPPQVGVSSNDKPLYINKTWNDALAYEVTMSKKFVTLGDELPLKMKFSPLEKGVILKRVKINIIETITYSSKDLRYEYEDMEYPIHDKFITGSNETEDSYKVTPLLELRCAPRKASQSLREVTVKNNSRVNSENLLDSCFEATPHNKTVQISGPLKVLTYLSFKNQENISKSTKETKVANEQYELDLKTFYNDFKHKIHPDSSNSKYIKISHKFQIALRVSRMDTEEKKYHHYEVLIDTPLYILNENCISSNLVLPSYDSTTHNFINDFEINLESQQLPTFEEATTPKTSPLLIPVREDTMLSRTSTIGTVALERWRSNIDDVLTSPERQRRRPSRVSSDESHPVDDESQLPPPPEYSESVPLLSDDEGSLISSLSSYTLDNSSRNASSYNSRPREQRETQLGDLDHESMDLTEQFHRAVYEGQSMPGAR